MVPVFSRDEFNTDLDVIHAKSLCPCQAVFHYHEINEIYLCLTESMEYLAGSKVYQLSRGDVMIFSAMDIHRPFPPAGGSYERWMLLFRTEFIDSLNTEKTDLLGLFSDRPPDFNHKIHLTDSQLAELLCLFEKTSGTLNTVGYGSDIRQKILLAEILLFLRVIYKPVPSATTGWNSQRMSAILRYLHSHFQEEISLSQLSAVFHLNKNYLNDLFKQQTGFTISQYLIQYRILQSKILLRRMIPVTDTAMECGFPSLSHFIRTFGRHVGISPGKYQKQSGQLHPSR